MGGHHKHLLIYCKLSWRQKHSAQKDQPSVLRTSFCNWRRHLMTTIFVDRYCLIASDAVSIHKRLTVSVTSAV